METELEDIPFVGAQLMTDTKKKTLPYFDFLVQFCAQLTIYVQYIPTISRNI